MPNFYGSNKGTPDSGLIGVTERGDAGIDFSWAERINDPQWAGAILITKRMSPQFNQLVMACRKPVIIHCTCTGNGGTWVEPNVPPFQEQLDNLADLIKMGFPSSRTVLRIDPIIPTPEFLGNSERMIQYVLEKNIPVGRVRFSLLDQYVHVTRRLQEQGRPPFYPDINGTRQFNPTYAMKHAALSILLKYPFTYATCAEDWAPAMAKTITARMPVGTPRGKCVIRGCVSTEDIALLGIPTPPAMQENPQNRTGCHCLSIKGELLTNRTPCPNKCVYCYWRANQ